MCADEQELPFLEPADGRRERVDVRVARRRAQALQDARLVALGLQPTDEPGAGVRHRLVVEVDGVLGREHGADPERPALLEQRQDRLLRGRRRRRRHVPEDLIHVDERAQVGRPRQPAHPRDDLRQHKRDDELALLVREVGEVHDRRPRPVRRAEEHGGIERRSLAPGGERRRRGEPVQPQRELLPVLRGEERVELEDAELPQWGPLDVADQGAEIEIAACPPGVLDEIGEQHVLAARQRIGGDPDEPEEARHRALDLVPERLRLGLPGERRRAQRADQVQRHARGRAGRVDGQLGRVAVRLDPGGVDPAGGETLRPVSGRLRGELVEREAGGAGVRLVHPGAEARGGEVGEGEEEVAHVALRVEHERGDPSR